MPDNTKDKQDRELIDTQIASLIATTVKLNKEIKWYEITIVIAITLAVVAFTKLFL